MSEKTEQGDLFAGSSVAGVDGAIAINERCSIRTEQEHRIVLVAGLPLSHYAVGDRAAEAYTMATLVEQGWADQNDVAEAFACSSRTVRRYQERLEEGGLAALVKSVGYPKGKPRISPSRSRRIHKLKGRGESNRTIAKHLGVTEKAVRKILRRQGWDARRTGDDDLPFASAGADPNLSASQSKSPQRAVSDPAIPAIPPKDPAVPLSESPASAADPNLSAFASDEELPASFDVDPSDRKIDRLFASLGLLDDAAPLFRAGCKIPRAGVLLALPALINSGVLESARDVYGSIGPAFYGLRTSILALLLMALLRIKRPEALKEHVPDDLGRLLGLDRAPEVKTLRRKLSRLAALGRATSFGQALAERRVALRGAAIGFLYVDGHVRVYHGKRVIPKAHVARMKFCIPATTDYWVNVEKGDPLFVVTAEANAGLVKMLPPILAEVRGLIGKRRVTIVFDRGGFSPRLFQRILAEGFDFLTYRKGHFRRLPKRKFHKRTTTVDGKKVIYMLADQNVRLLGGKLGLRQITRLSENGHQTPILTSRRDLRDFEVAFRMFERWRQENFFKYLREEYALDALADHQAEPADPMREVPNPAWAALQAEMRQVRAEIVGFSARLGLEAFSNIEDMRHTMRGFKIAHASKTRPIAEALKLHAALNAKRASVPRRVPVKQVVDGTVVQLAAERKHITSLLKMVAYQAESDLARLVEPHYKRAADEGRTLIQSALASAADIEVSETELRIVLAALSSAHRTRAIAAICAELNNNPVRFPGTRLRLRFDIASTVPPNP